MFTFFYYTTKYTAHTSSRRLLSHNNIRISHTKISYEFSVWYKNRTEFLFDLTAMNFLQYTKLCMQFIILLHNNTYTMAVHPMTLIQSSFFGG